MKLLEFIVAYFVILFCNQNHFIHANLSPPSSPRNLLPFKANNFVPNALDGFNVVKTSNYLIDYIHITGMQMLNINQPHTTLDNLSNHLSVSSPMTVFPSPYPRELFNLAKSLQKAMAEIHYRGSLDYEFLMEAIGNTEKEADPFVWGIVDIMKKIHKNKEFRQSGVLILQRSDYLTEKEEGKSAVLKQIEVSSHGASGAGGSYQGNLVHQRMLKKIQHSVDKEKIPNWLNKAAVEKNNALIRGQANAIYEAWKIYRDKKNDPKAVILLVYATKRRAHSHFEQLLYAQFELENIAWPNGDRPHVEQITVEECTKKLRLNPKTFDLHIHDPEDPFLADPEDTFIGGKRVAVVKWLDHFLPEHISTERQWEMRYDMERSTAIVSPNVFTYLMGTKKVQYALTRPGVLERYLVGEERKHLEKLRGTFIKMWALGKEDDQLIQKAIDNPADFVLKANREGGKGNYFDEKLVGQMKELLENPNLRSGYILQKRIRPFYIKNAVFPLPPDPETLIQMKDMDSELSVFGSLIVKISDEGAHMLVDNTLDGYGVRTKLKSKPMCTISSGQGGMDSFVLFDQSNFE